MADGNPARDVQRRSIVIEAVRPEVDGGRFPVKREVGDWLAVSATVFKEGHDRLAVVVRHRLAGEKGWRETPMTLANPGLDLWQASFPLEQNGRYVYTIEAWHDAFESWRAEIGKKRDAGHDVHLELSEGRDIVAGVETRAKGPDMARLRQIVAAFDATEDVARRTDLLLGDELRTLAARWPDRTIAARYDRELEVVVDRVRARYGTWYEMFPRSQGKVPGKSATFDDCIERLPEIESLGFDVVYLVPIHPIGRIHRKGRNNSLKAGPDDPGSPYAIGSAEGGHTAIDPELGTLDDFRRFVQAAKERGMEIALDFAIQCAPDHPWVKEHPEWFVFRPDGTIKYAENPPKKYEDIVNVDFYCEARESLWRALRDVVLFWIGQGVRIFRVDNPHTKPLPFWEWLIRTVQDEHPDAIFLSEAFTRPPMMRQLAKAGFTQSYTYFTWRNFKYELVEYLTELTATDVKEYMRPNFFTNTPDILPTILQRGGRPAFMIRFALAATLSPSYGIYNGFELCENAAIEGREEYYDSEKYAYRVWDWDRPGNIKDWIRAINRIRRENPALQELENLTFYPAHDDSILFYGKMNFLRDNVVFVAVNVDPFQPHEAEVEFPIQLFGVPEHEPFGIEDLLTGERQLWQGSRHRLRLDPHHNPAMLLRFLAWPPADFRNPHAG
jgi:starch synthase (maltosyl-transferring)